MGSFSRIIELEDYNKNMALNALGLKFVTNVDHVNYVHI